jgi:hypothetical protein
MKRLTKVVLDQTVCQNPDCPHTDHEVLVVHSRCHPTQGVTLSYQIGTGVFTVNCKECGAPIVEIAVA